MSTDNSKSPGAQVHPPAQPPKSPSVAHPWTSQGSPSHNCLLLLLLSVFYVFLIFREETCHAPLIVGKQTSPACARQEDVVMRHTQPELWSQEPPAQDLESICDQHHQHIPTDPVTALGAARRGCKGSRDSTTGEGGCNSPRSTSHSGEEAPLHSLRGPSTGNIIPNSDRDTGLGRSRLPGLTAAGNWSAVSEGLIGPELKLDTDWVSESSSDTKLLQLSSSKASEATRRREHQSHRVWQIAT